MSFSIGDFFRRRAWGLPARANGRSQAQKLVQQGISAETSGDATKALEQFRKAVAADDRYAPAHNRLGIALQAAGDIDAAVACYERAIAADPDYHVAHFNLGLAQLQGSRFPEAEASFRSTLRVRQEFPDAWVGLASALEAQGLPDEALAALDQAGDHIGALFNAALLARKSGRLDAAIERARHLVELEPDNCTALCMLGASLRDSGWKDEAERRFRDALAFEPNHPEAKTSLALMLKEQGRMLEAVPLLFDLVESMPGDANMRLVLAEALHGVALTAAGPRDRAILLDLCTDDRISTHFIGPAIVESITADEGFRVLLQHAARGDDPFASAAPAVAAYLRDPLVIAALPRVCVASPAADDVFAHVRRSIAMRHCATSAALADPAVPPQFVWALARQCFFNGYAYFATEEEQQRVAGLRNSLASELEQPLLQPSLLQPALSVVALYDSLHTLQGAERLLEVPLDTWSEGFRPLVIEQLLDRKREKEIAAQLVPITRIDDEISKAVRAQYEENPYPRWVTAPSPRSGTIASLWKRLRPDLAEQVPPAPVPVLIAGCGTGHHPIQVARAYPDCEILAVDLSIASLAYAIRMTERFAITNITYRQGDILELGTLDRKFGLVECGGVLHHLRDPMAGWRVLVDLLAPNGLMKIALYSEKARAAVRAARDFAASLDYPLTPDGIRRCRHALARLPEGHPAREIMTFGDFFTLDGCRDLMLNVQEHQFTLPRIAQCLGQLDLRLLMLETPARTRQRFLEMFPGSDPDTDLAAWDQFEDAYPDTFRGMFSFWCCRR